MIPASAELPGAVNPGRLHPFTLLLGPIATLLIVQTAASIPSIDWLYDSMEEVIDAIVEREV